MITCLGKTKHWLEWIWRMTSFWKKLERGQSSKDGIDVLIVESAEAGSIEAMVEDAISFAEVEGGGFLAAH